jgi:heme O synthase-like polyprenyltransferase
MIGWVGAGGSFNVQAWFLFGILFWWQLPHFMAISWLVREEYEKAGYQMWSNGDVSGKRSGQLSAVFAVCLAVFSLLPAAFGFTGLLWLIVGPLLGFLMAGLALKFIKDGERTSARKLFFSTLLYLPVAFVVLLIAWKNA